MVQLGKSFDPQLSSENLREERRRTGKFIATGTAIVLSLLGLYEALIRGTPEYAALFAPALIMFIYIAWVLYVSTKRNKIFKEDTPVLKEILIRANEDVEIALNNIENATKVSSSYDEEVPFKQKDHPDRPPYFYNRSYSIG